MDTFSINTSQNVHIQFNVASLGQRILAGIIDLLIMGFYLAGITALLTYFRNNDYGTTGITYQVIYVIVSIPIWFFHLIFEIFDKGRSPGKRIMKIQVVKQDGSETSISTYLIRWIFRIIDVVIFTPVVAIITIAAGSKGQRIGDIVAGTLVISHRKREWDSVFNYQDYDENYQVRFPEVQSISQEQMLTIRKTYAQSRKTGNIMVLEKISDTITHITGITRPIELTADVFIGGVIEDYYFIKHTQEA